MFRRIIAEIIYILSVQLLIPAGKLAFKNCDIYKEVHGWSCHLEKS